MLTALWNSNIIASKGCFEAILGCILAYQGGLEVTINVIGRPVSDCEMSAVAAKRRLEDLCREPCVNYIGAVSSDAAEELVANSDVVLLPSIYKSECQPLALISAMCHGRELIVAKTPALCATVGNYPVWYTQRDPTDIAHTLQLVAGTRLVSDSDVEAARRRFSVARFREQFIALMDDIVSHG